MVLATSTMSHQAPTPSASDEQQTTDYHTHPSITEFLETSALALAPSPEHPTFGGSGGDVNWSMAEGLGFNGDSIDPLSQPDGMNGDSMNAWNFVQPHHTLSHVSSTSSLNSLSSVDSNGHHDLMVDLPTGQSDMFLDHSRHSSISYDKSDDFNTWSMPTIAPYQSFTMPPTQARANPPLSLQTQGLGRISTRPRSSSRVQPYQRKRSESLSTTSEADDVPALMSTTSTRSLSGFNNLVTPMERVSLHHRRTSSNTSAFSPHKNSPMRPSLTRGHRSASLVSTMKRTSQDSFVAFGQLTGSAEERELKARNKLIDKAKEVLEAAGSGQDKLRNLWVRSWLQLSYSQQSGSTVPRQGLYHSYTISCDEYGVRPINSASFGKAVRHAFPGIKTRRLGNRGNSKYHYVSLRPAIRIEAMRLNDYGDSSGQWHVAPEDGALGFRPTDGNELDEEDEIDDTEMEDEDEGFSNLRKSTSSTSMDTRAWTRPTAYTRRHTTSSLSPFSPVDITPVYHLPGYPGIADLSSLAGPAETAQMFWTVFNQHQESLADCVRALRFDMFESLIRTFWAQQMPMNMEICQRPEISLKIDEAMAVAYDHFLSILLQKLPTPLTGAVLSGLRDLSEHLQTVMEESMHNYAPDFAETKIELAVRVGHLFGRFAALYQLSTALSPILSDRVQVKTMLKSWDALDLRVVVDQCVLSSNCRSEFVEDVFDGFQNWLEDVEKSPSRGDKWISKLGEWVEGKIEEAQQYGVTLSSLPTRIGFISSQIVRDFTLRSDSSFGLFQLVKTWIDDWVILYVLRRTALSRSSLDVAQSGFPEMSVMIPTQPHGSFGNDLSTAVPLHHVSNGINGHSQSMGLGLNLSRSGSTLGVPNLVNLNSNINPGFGLPPSEFQLRVPQSTSMM